MTDLQKEMEATSNMVEKPPKTLEPPKNLEPQTKFVLNKCCFCIPLRIGCLILAYLFLVGTIIVGIWSTIGLVTVVTFMLHYPGNHEIFTIMLVIHAVILAVTLIALAFNILLLIGLHKERRNFVKIFLIFQLVFVILNILQHILNLVFGQTNTVGIVVGLASDVLNIYYLFVIRSQYVKMGEAINKLPTQVYRDGRVEIMP